MKIQLHTRQSPSPLRKLLLNLQHLRMCLLQTLEIPLDPLTLELVHRAKRARFVQLLAEGLVCLE